MANKRGLHEQMESLCNGEKGAQQPDDPADSAGQVGPFEVC